MKTLRKLLAGLIVVTLIVVVGASAVIHFAGGRALKYTIETVGGNTLNLKVSLADVSFSILGGKLKLKGLAVANPPGYEYANLLELDMVEVDMDIGSLLNDTVDIRNVNLDGVSVVIEQKDIRSNNLQDVLNNLPATGQDTREDEDARKLRIDRLSITNTTVTAKLLPLPGRASSIPLKLEPIEMTNLGSDNKLTMAILTARILQAIAAAVARQGKTLLPEDIIAPMRSVLGASGQLLIETGKGLLENGRELIEAGKDLQKNVVDGLKGLLPGKKE